MHILPTLSSDLRKRVTALGVFWRWALDLANVLAGSAAAEVDIIFPRGTPWEKQNGTWKSHLGKRNEQLAQPKNKIDGKGTKKSLNRGSMRFLWFHFQKKYFERNHHSFSFWGGFCIAPGQSPWLPMKILTLDPPLELQHTHSGTHWEATRRPRTGIDLLLVDPDKGVIEWKSQSAHQPRRKKVRTPDEMGRWAFKGAV